MTEGDHNASMEKVTESRELTGYVRRYGNFVRVSKWHW